MTITNTDINTYRNTLMEELRKLDACATELRMVTEDMIMLSISGNIQPREAAWSIVE